MNYEEKKKYLESYKFLDIHINALLDEKQVWYDRALKIKRQFPSAECLRKVMSLEEEINYNIDCLVDLRRDINRNINKIDDEICKKILTLKYINMKTFEEISEQIGYSEKQISRLHKKAVLLLKI